MTEDLPTTSYAVLGLLSLRSWTGYELAQQGRRNLDFYWPKEDSVFYEEPRRLVARGLARATKERNGGRSRNRYEITDEGRRALRDWLARPSGMPRFEIEPILRFSFADQGDLSDALAAVATMREWATRNLTVGRMILEGYRAGEAPFPDRMHINVLAASLFGDLFQAVVDFAERAERELATWDRTDGLGMTDRTRELLDEVLAAHPPR